MPEQSEFQKVHFMSFFYHKAEIFDLSVSVLSFMKQFKRTMPLAFYLGLLWVPSASVWPAPRHVNAGGNVAVKDGVFLLQEGG